jgi:hypothetical protein
MINKHNAQHDKFKEAAKELGCDEDEARFDDTVKKLAKSGGKADLTNPSKSESIEEGAG